MSACAMPKCLLPHFCVQGEFDVANGTYEQAAAAAVEGLESAGTTGPVSQSTAQELVAESWMGQAQVRLLSQASK